MPKNILTLSQFPSSSSYAQGKDGILCTHNYTAQKKSNWLYFIVTNCGQALRANEVSGNCEWIRQDGQKIESIYSLDEILLQKFTTWRILEVTVKEFNKFVRSEHNKT